MAAEFALVKLRATHGSRKKGVSASELQLQQAVERLDILGVTQLAITLASLGWDDLASPP